MPPKKRFDKKNAIKFSLVAKPPGDDDYDLDAPKYMLQPSFMPKGVKNREDLLARLPKGFPVELIESDYQEQTVFTREGGEDEEYFPDDKSLSSKDRSRREANIMASFAGSRDGDDDDDMDFDDNDLFMEDDDENMEVIDMNTPQVHKSQKLLYQYDYNRHFRPMTGTGVFIGNTDGITTDPELYNPIVPAIAMNDEDMRALEDDEKAKKLAAKHVGVVKSIISGLEIPIPKAGKNIKITDDFLEALECGNENGFLELEDNFYELAMGSDDDDEEEEVVSNPANDLEILIDNEEERLLDQGLPPQVARMLAETKIRYQEKMKKDASKPIVVNEAIRKEFAKENYQNEEEEYDGYTQEIEDLEAEMNYNSDYDEEELEVMEQAKLLPPEMTDDERIDMLKKKAANLKGKKEDMISKKDKTTAKKDSSSKSTIKKGQNNASSTSSSKNNTGARKKKLRFQDDDVEEEVIFQPGTDAQEQRLMQLFIKDKEGAMQEDDEEEVAALNKKNKFKQGMVLFKEDVAEEEIEQDIEEIFDIEEEYDDEEDFEDLYYDEEEDGEEYDQYDEEDGEYYSDEDEDYFDDEADDVTETMRLLEQMNLRVQQPLRLDATDEEIRQANEDKQFMDLLHEYEYVEEDEDEEYGLNDPQLKDINNEQVRENILSYKKLEKLKRRAMVMTSSQRDYLREFINKRLLEESMIDETIEEVTKAIDKQFKKKNREQWDAESICSTYSNTENIPTMIREVRVKNQTKISIAVAMQKHRLDREDMKKEKVAALQARAELEAQQGIAVLGDNRHALAAAKAGEDQDDEDEDEDEEYEYVQNTSLGRQKGESKEDKKARKQAVKQERQAKRVQKKELKDMFKKEKKKQDKMDVMNRALNMAHKKL